MFVRALARTKQCAAVKIWVGKRLTSLCFRPTHSLRFWMTVYVHTSFVSFSQRCCHSVKTLCQIVVLIPRMSVLASLAIFVSFFGLRIYNRILSSGQWVTFLLELLLLTLKLCGRLIIFSMCTSFDLLQAFVGDVYFALLFSRKLVRRIDYAIYKLVCFASFKFGIILHRVVVVAHG